MTAPALVPAAETRREIIVVNSRFIAALAPAATVAAARAFIDRIRAEFPDASHHVPAYLVGTGQTVTAHCSDDGEPGGTAGRPALAVLQGSGLGDVVVVVTRYFGGTLLGTGGLVRAYTEAVQAVVAATPRARKVPGQILLLALPYNLLERLRLLVARTGGVLLEESFGADITATLQFPAARVAEFQAALRELSAGQLQAEVMETVEILTPA